MRHLTDSGADDIVWGVVKPSSGTVALSPCVRDKVVQEVIRLILEAIYDSPDGPYFLETSHGFRQNRSCYTALQEIRLKWVATNWFIEGDIHACFDEIEHGILVNVLRKKIKDERFLNLIWKLLRAGYFDLHGARKDSLIGAPQGGIASPILSNIYLHELDEKVEEIRQRLESGKKKGRNPPYGKLAIRKHRLAKQGQTAGQEFQDITRQLRLLIRLHWGSTPYSFEKITLSASMCQCDIVELYTHSSCN